ncbi:MAG: DUF6569 family protein [Thermoguttaceae bacterium]
MNTRCDCISTVSRKAPAVLAAAVCLCAVIFNETPAGAQRPATDRHVRELARYLDGVKIAEPLVYRQLAVYPILADDVPLVRGQWLTLDAAIARGILLVSEKGGGSVPVVRVENLSRDQYIFIMTGEVVAGGMQTRTVRHDVVLAPGQRIDLDVFCVEAHRWSGEAKFSAGSKTMLPQSIQEKLRGGADQVKVWSEVTRNNAALKAENATDSLDAALQSAPVREKLEDVRRKIVPEVPQGSTGFIFVARGRALGAEMFGSAALARELLPKLLDSYAVDYVVLRGPGLEPDGGGEHRAAIDFFERVCRTGSQRGPSPGSGSGIRTRQGGLLGDGVSLDGTLVHYGVQIGAQVVPQPRPWSRPSIIYPNPRQQ